MAQKTDLAYSTLRKLVDGAMTTNLVPKGPQGDVREVLLREIELDIEDIVFAMISMT